MTEPTIAELMRAWRRAAGINAAEAGRRLGLSRRTIEGIEQGRANWHDKERRIALEALIREARQAPS